MVVNLQYFAGALESELRDVYPHLRVPRLSIPPFCECNGVAACASTAAVASSESFIRFGRHFELDAGTETSEYLFIYIGSCESLFLTSCMMTFNRSRFICYDPTTKTVKSDAWNVNKLLMKRYYMVERARDATVVGILAGTLSASGYDDAKRRLKEAVRRAGKRSYVFSLGTLKVAKMANHANVDVFVLIACPENSLIDSTEFYRPVVTPFEMELACDPSRQWTGNYEVDFRQLLPGGFKFKN